MTAEPKRRRGRPSEPSATTTVTPGGLLRKTVYFSDQEWQAITRAALERKTTLSDVIRGAIREHLNLCWAEEPARHRR